MARYIDADKIADIIKMDIKQCEIDVLESCGDEFYAMAVNSRSTAMYSILGEIERATTADVAPKSEVAREIFEEIEKLSHRFMNDEHYIFGDMVWDIAELKKKYTGEQT